VYITLRIRALFAAFMAYMLRGKLDFNSKSD
jgi:hypothetical protein